MSRRARRPIRAPALVLATAGLAASLAAAPPAAAVSVSEVADIAFDVAVLRPLNATSLVLGGVFFAVSGPLVAPFVGLDGAWDAFVIAPYEYTIERELGEF